MKQFKLGILTSHLIQYQTPLFRVLAQNQEIDLKVYFCNDFGVHKEKFDSEFGREIKWDIPLLEGYSSKFLKNYSLYPSNNFFGQINFSIIIYLIKNHHDAIVLYGWNSFTNWLAFIVAIITRTPVFLRGESLLSQELRKSPWKLLLKKIIFIPIFKFVSAFLFIGEDNKNFYIYYKVPRTKLFFTPYAVDNKRFIREKKVLKDKFSDLCAIEGFSSNSVIFLFVGKLIEKKRPFDALRAYEMMFKKVSLLSKKPALIFVGDGEQRTDLERYVKQKQLKGVYFVGFKNQTELSRYYGVADVFVLPSGDGETWGLVVNEAMCFSLPIIISNRVGCGPDLVQEGENGFVVPFADINALAYAFINLFENTEKRKMFGARSFSIINHYTFEKDIEGFLIALKTK